MWMRRQRREPPSPVRRPAGGVRILVFPYCVTNCNTRTRTRARAHTHTHTHTHTRTTQADPGRRFAAIGFLGVWVRIPPAAVIVLCCQVEVSATGLSLVWKSLTECGVSECDL